MKNYHTLTRRDFLRSTLTGAASIAAASSITTNFALAKSLSTSQAIAFDDYKALVCVFLFGGNDSFNMLVPTDANEYLTYQNVRQNLAYDQANLLTIQPLQPQSIALGMPPSMASIHQLFQQQKLSLILNTGPLLAPVSKQQILQNEKLLPPQLFSHNDQQYLWQAANPGSNLSGWAGRMADLIMDSSNPLSMNISINGTNLLQTGTRSLPYSMSPEGAENFAALIPEQDWNALRVDAHQQLLALASTPLERVYADTVTRAAENNRTITKALENISDSTDQYPSANELAEQLAMVAKLASVQQTLGHQRQIFFVGMGGWDTHDNQAQLHPSLLAQLGDALLAFQNNIDEIGLSDNITTFTLSDFGRTLTSNGDGTDHGWGGHQLVMGGAVNGGDLYGTLPSLELNSDDDLGDGRIIPTISVEQYAATLARWFGLSDTELAAIFPNLNNFSASNVGFMNLS